MEHVTVSEGNADIRVHIGDTRMPVAEDNGAEGKTNSNACVLDGLSQRQNAVNEVKLNILRSALDFDVAEEPDDFPSLGFAPRFLSYTDNVDITETADISGVTEDAATDDITQIPDGNAINDAAAVTDDTATDHVTTAADDARIGDVTGAASDTGSDKVADDTGVEDQPRGTGWTYRDDSHTYRTGEAGYWAPVPGHPTAEEWVPLETSKTTSSRCQDVGNGRSCGQRCGTCFESAMFRICCIPFMTCLFCCGPPGWLFIYVILKLREKQKRDRERYDEP